eukprot:328653-Amphidinium_carterae.1
MRAAASSKNRTTLKCGSDILQSIAVRDCRTDTNLTSIIQLWLQQITNGLQWHAASRHFERVPWVGVEWQLGPT